MIAGFLRPTEGTLEVLGYAPTQVDELRSRIGVLPQDALLPAHRQGRRVPRAHGAPPGHPEGQGRRDRARGPRRGRRHATGGTCVAAASRTAWRSASQLAQALIGDPEVVLLDEPTAGLDPRVAYEVRQLIKSRKGRCTLIVSSHNLQELEEICDAAASSIAAASSRRAPSPSSPRRAKRSTSSSRGRRPARRPLRAGRSLAVRELPMVKRVECDDEQARARRLLRPRRRRRRRRAGHRRRLVGSPEQPSRIAGVTKGRGLEQRVMELT